MIKPARHEQILSELGRRGSISVEEIVALLNVSEATVRRDLRELEERGLIRRTRGGATLADDQNELPYPFKVTAFLAEKRRIGVAAAELIEPGMVIGCSGGTTVAQVIRALRGKRVTVVTNAVTVAAELATSPEAEVVVTGGTLRSRSYEMIGHIAIQTIRDFRFDLALLGVDGLTTEHGLTTYNHQEAHVNRTFIECAREVMVVADHSKLGKVTPALITGVDRLTTLVTDSEAEPELVKPFQQLGIRVVLA